MSRAQRSKRIWFVGQLPPPLSGQTVFNERMARGMAGIGQLRVLPTGGSALAKVVRAVLNPLRLGFALRRGDVVYTSVPGQKGLWLFLPTVLALRLRRTRFFAHHHSYRAVALGPMPPVRLLGRFGGGLATHVLLCERMRDDYAALYRTNARERFVVLPNAALFSGGEALARLPRGGPAAIGHLSVMTEEKGVPYLLELWQRFLDAGGEGQLLLAGPIPDPALRETVEAAAAASGGRIAWLGTVTGADKQAFYDRIDLLVLPTRLVDEADPLVLLEAYSAGAAVLAPDRGCIRSRLVSDDWLMSMALERDVALLGARLDEAVGARADLPQALMAHAEALRDKARADAHAFLGEFGLDRAQAEQVLRLMRG